MVLLLAGHAYGRAGVRVHGDGAPSSRVARSSLPWTVGVAPGEAIYRLRVVVTAVDCLRRLLDDVVGVLLRESHAPAGIRRGQDALIESLEEATFESFEGLL